MPDDLRRTNLFTKLSVSIYPRFHFDVSSAVIAKELCEGTVAGLLRKQRNLNLEPLRRRAEPSRSGSRSKSKVMPSAVPAMLRIPSRSSSKGNIMEQGESQMHLDAEDTDDAADADVKPAASQVPVSLSDATPLVERPTDVETGQ